MFNRRKSIQGRMLLWILSVSGLILASVIFWSYMTARNRLEQDIQDKARFLVEGAARQIDSHLGPLQGIIQGVAQTFETQQRSFTFAEVRALQTAILKKNAGILGMAVAFEPGMAPPGWKDYAAWAFREGDQLFYEDLSGELFLHTLDDWFMLPKYLERPVWSEPYDWHGLLMVTYSVPFFWTDEQGNRQFVGVVTCDLSLGFLSQLLAELPLGKKDYAMLISQNGTFVTHPDQQLVLNESMFSLAQERRSPQMRIIGQRMIAGETALTDFISHVTQELSWLAYTPLRSADWTMAVMISRQAMQEAVMRLSQRQLLIGAVGMWVLFFAVALIARSISRPLERLEVAAVDLSRGNLNVTLPVPQGNDEVARLTQSFIVMRNNLRRYMSDLEVTTAARERMHSELRIAHDIQMSLVPKTFPPIPSRSDLDLYAALVPAREVGGDFYDFFALDENRLVLAIGDVSGKGVPAALFMAVTRSFLRSAFRSDSDTASVMDHVNRELVVGNDSCMFVTLFCAVLNLDTGTLEYVNAGHNPPLIRYPDGSMQWVAEPKGPIAGVVDDMKYPSGQLVLPPGALLLLYTDGVTEAMNVAQKLYGEDRLYAWLDKTDRTALCQDLTQSLLQEIRSFAGRAEQSDDITLLMVRKRPRRKELVSSGFEAQIKADLSALAPLLDQVDEFLEQRGIIDGRVFKVRLALEELLTNTIKYGCPSTGDKLLAQCWIRVALQLEIPLLLVIEDNAAPFDPSLDAPTPSLDAPLDKRKIGGLGLHMLKEMGMELSYRREDNRNHMELRIPESTLD